jgi:parallel beta-helix repeat protein
MRYAVPAGAVFVTAGGGTGGAGTESSPYESVATAVSKAVSGQTLVLRGGTYRESVKIPSGKALTIQPYPGEAVWFDGAGPVTGWVRSGSTWVVSNWTYLFDHRVSFGAGQDESSRYVDPAYPMAGYGDAVWINGVELTQVGSESAVTTGTFYVDETNKRLVIGSDPTGKLVEASKIAKAMQIQGAGTTVRGVGIKRYAAQLALFGAVSYEANNVTFENDVIADNATLGVGGWGDNATFRNVTVSGNGLLGIHGDKAPGLRVLDSVVSGNNDQRFKSQPVSAGLKITDSDGVRIEGNQITSNLAAGLWFDVTMRNWVVAGNTISSNTEGIVVELSGHGVIADNYLARNSKAAVGIFNSNAVQVWNNTMDSNSRSLQFLQDARRNTNSATKDYVPWVSGDITISNNVVAYGNGPCPILLQHLQGQPDEMGVEIDHNVYGAPTNLLTEVGCSTEGDGSIQRFGSLVGWSRATGDDTGSRVYEGPPLLRSDGRPEPTVLRAVEQVAAPLPGDVADVLGRSPGGRWLGAYPDAAPSR